MSTTRDTPPVARAKRVLAAAMLMFVKMEENIEEIKTAERYKDADTNEEVRNKLEHELNALRKAMAEFKEGFIEQLHVDIGNAELLPYTEAPP